MKKKFVALIFCTVFILLFHSSSYAVYAGDMYTYIYDFWGDERESPDAYKAEMLITGKSLGIGEFNDPQGLYIRDNRIYICDSGNNRIVVLEQNARDISVVEVIDTFNGMIDVNTFSNPNDIFVDKNGDYYICDTKNERIVHLNKDKELVKAIYKPVDETVDPKSEFLPLKLVVSDGGRLYVQVRNYNKGFVQFDRDGSFAGYMGANEVKFNFIDYVWKAFFYTDAQKAQVQQFVPTEYNNLAFDKDGFIFCTTSFFERDELREDKAKPIRRLNTMGKDILIKNGEFPPIGELQWGSADGIEGPSKLLDITVLDNDVYFTVDRVRGRIFGYDSQGNLLYAFAGLGNRLGYFQYPTAIEHMGYNLYVLDSKNLGITVFMPTQFGELIYSALEEYQIGNYDLSSVHWEEVLMQNGNYDLAYIGVGRSLLREGDYKTAMEYFELKKDYDNYSKAYKLYRKEWIEDNIGRIFIGIIGLLILIYGVKIVKTIKKEAAEYEAG